MVGLDGIFLWVLMSYKTLYFFFCQASENGKGFNKWRCRRHNISRMSHYWRKCMRKGKHEMFIFIKVVNGKWIL